MIGDKTTSSNIETSAQFHRILEETLYTHLRNRIDHCFANTGEVSYRYHAVRQDCGRAASRPVSLVQRDFRSRTQVVSDDSKDVHGTSYLSSNLFRISFSTAELCRK